VDSEPKRRFDQIARRLLAEYPAQPYESQLKNRVFLTGFIRSLPKQTIQIYFDLLIASERIVDRRRAGAVADLISSDEVEGKLWDNFHRYKDEESLIPLMNCLSEADLWQLMKKCWRAEFPSYRLENTQLSRINTIAVKELEFLKSRDPAYFIRAMAIKKGKVNARTIRQLVKMAKEEQKKFIVWYVGLTGNWDWVVKQINQ
jgi:hypothetical protein